MKRIHYWLSGLSITIILLSINRIFTFTQGHLQPFEFLRWQDFNAMLPIPLLSIIFFYLLKTEIVHDSVIIKKSVYVILNLVLVCGIYLFGAGSGTHELANYLNHRYCIDGQMGGRLCEIIGQNDDQFSHYVYYAGFILMNIALMGIESLFPRKEKVKRADLLLIAGNALFIASGIFVNTAFEDAGIDLVVFSSVMLISILLLARHGFRRLPVTFYFSLSYTVGTLSSILYKSLQ